MGEFIQGISTFPTIFYTGLLILVIFYWSLALIGITGLDSIEADVDLDSDGDISGLAGFLSKFKLDGIPLTITFSFLILASWVLCFFAAYFIYPLLPEGWIQTTIGVWFLVIAPFIAAPIISPLLQPLRSLFAKSANKSAADVVGQYAVVRSGKVSATFGEAECQDGGAGMIIKIRAAEPNTIKRGDSVRLKKYDTANGTYQV